MPCASYCMTHIASYRRVHHIWVIHVARECMTHMRCSGRSSTGVGLCVLWTRKRVRKTLEKAPTKGSRDHPFDTQQAFKRLQKHVYRWSQLSPDLFWLSSSSWLRIIAKHFKIWRDFYVLDATQKRLNRWFQPLDAVLTSVQNNVHQSVWTGTHLCANPIRLPLELQPLWPLTCNWKNWTRYKLSKRFVNFFKTVLRTLEMPLLITSILAKMM